MTRSFKKVEVRMPSGDDQGKGRKFSLGVVEKNRIDMTFEVVYAQEREPERKGKPFCVGQAHQQSSHQSGTTGHGNRIEIRPLLRGFRQTLVEIGRANV